MPGRCCRRPYGVPQVSNGIVHRLPNLRSVPSTDRYLGKGQAKSSASERQAAAGASGLTGILVAAIKVQIIDDGANLALAEAGYLNHRLLCTDHPIRLLDAPQRSKYQQD